MSDASSRFPSACRSFLAQLDELANASSPASEHAETCARCADRLAAARRQVEQLRQMPVPALPAAMQDAESFLAGVYERAQGALEAAPWTEALRQPAPLPPAMADTAGFLERIHERAITELELAPEADPVRHTLATVLRAPADVAWVQDGASTAEGPLRHALTGTRTPGWLWQRIQAAVVAAGDEPRSARFAVAASRWGGLIAAAIMVSALLFLHSPFTEQQNQGTSRRNDIVIEYVAEPFESSLALHGLTRVGR